jgi:rhodanese-related sulfurtransferase
MFAMPLSVPVKEAAERHQNGATLVDVRETDEFEAVSAPGAINVPLSLIQKHGKKAFTKAGVGPETDGLLVICRSGGRSAMACQLIGAQAINVEGGMLAWVTAGLPTS